MAANLLVTTKDKFKATNLLVTTKGKFNWKKRVSVFLYLFPYSKENHHANQEQFNKITATANNPSDIY